MRTMDGYYYVLICKAYDEESVVFNVTVLRSAI